MLTATTQAPTANASKYLQQLCKHFAHKVDVTYDETHGECRFSCGTARLDAKGDGLRIAVEAADGDKFAETKDVIERHLIRFAFREEMQPLTWLN